MIFKNKFKEWQAILPLWFPGITFICMALLFASLLFIVGASALLLFFLPFVVFSLGMIFLLSFYIKEDEDTDISIVKKMMQKKGQFQLADLAASYGIPEKKMERMFAELLRLGVYSICYYKPEKTLYVFDDNQPLEHCPRCAADFSESIYGKCPNCKMLFSQTLLKKPFYYL